MNLFRRIVLLALLFIPRPMAASSAPENGTPASIIGESVRFVHFSLEQGLSNPRVRSILQDRHGFLWIGTADGLNRYDGYEFKVYRSEQTNPQTVSQNVAAVLYEDHDGYLWVGTQANGLNRFDPTTETFTRFLSDPADLHSLSHNTVQCIYQDRNGVLWVGTWKGGLNRFDRETQTFTRFQNDPEDPNSLGSDDVRSIYEDGAGALWIATYGGGLNKLVPGAQPTDPPTFRRYRHDPADPNSLSNDQVYALYRDHLGVLWIATWDGGLDRYDPKSDNFVHYRSNPDDPHSLSIDRITAIVEDTAGQLWLSTYGGGVDRFDRKTETFTRYRHNPADPWSLSNDVVLDLYADKTGFLYFGTVGSGFDRLDQGQKPFHVLRGKPGDLNTLSQNDIRAIYQDHEGILWVGTGASGLDRYDPKSAAFTHFQSDPNDPTSLSNNTVWSILEDRAGVLWVGTFGGLNKFDRESGRFTRYQHDPNEPKSLSENTVYALYEDSAGTFWVGTYGGLNKFDRQAGTFSHYLHHEDNLTGLSDNNIDALYEDASGTLWVGTAGGLDKLDRQSGLFTHYWHNPNDPHSLSNNIIYTIYGEPTGLLWIGTADGLNRFDPKTEQFTRYTQQEGLPHPAIWSILPDKQGNLWIGTAGGLARLDPQTAKFRTYDTADGLPSPIFTQNAYAQSNNGELLLGTTDGLVAFFPEQIKDDPNAPPIVFTDFQLANKPVPIGPDSVLNQAINETTVLTLSPRDRVISFAFAALNFRSPQKNRYRYQLEGFDDGWIEVDSRRRFVTYTNLVPGNYTFKVQGSNSDGVWNEQGRSILIRVTPPWWKTLWFRLAIAAIIVGEIFYAYRFRMKAVEHRTRELEAMVEARTEALLLTNERLQQEIAKGESIHQTLRASEARFRAVWEVATDALALIDAEGILVDANPAYFQLYGYPPEEMIGHNFVMLFPEEERDGVIESYKANFADAEATRHMVVTVRRADGALRIIDVIATRFEWHKQDALMLSTIRDITERTQTERALEVNQERYQLATRAAKVGVWDWNLRTNEFYLDPNIKALLGYEDAEIPNDSERWTSHIYPEDRQPALAAAQAHVDGQTPEYSFEHRMVHKDGSLRWIYARGQAMRDADGRAVRLVGTDADITDLKQIELTQQKLNQELNQRVDELSTLNKIAQAVTAAGDLQPVLDYAAATITRLFDTSGTSIGLLNADGTQLTISTHEPAPAPANGEGAGDGEMPRMVGATFPIEQNLNMPRLFRDGKPITVYGPQRDPVLAGIWAYARRYKIPSLILVPMFVRGEVIGVIVTSARQPERRFTPAELTLAETIASQLAGAIENARLFSEEHRLRQLAEQRSRELTTLLHVSNEVASTLELESLLNLIVDQLERIVEVKSLILLGLEDNDLTMLAYRGPAPYPPSMPQWFAAEPLRKQTRLFRDHTPLIVDDLTEELAIRETLKLTFGDQTDRLLPAVHACLLVPLVAGDRDIGLLCLSHQQPNYYTPSHAAYVGALALQAAIAIQNAHTYRQAQIAAADEERNRLARELHDAVSQTLFSASLIAEALPGAWQQSPAKAEFGLRELQRLTRGALAEMRTLLLELRPAAVLQKPLGEILHSLTQAFMSRTQIPFTLIIKGDTILPAALQIALYRITQEALNNIFKHADANQVEISLDCSPEGVELRIHDDGIGFDPAEVEPDHLGLAIMAERAEQVGATLRVESQPGQGTLLVVHHAHPT